MFTCRPAGKADTDRSLLSVLSQNGEGDQLADTWARSSRKFRDVYEDLLARTGELNESEATVVVPLGEGAVALHTEV